MVAGDVVNSIIDIANGATVDFQPAATVDVAILSCSGEFTDLFIGITDGTIATVFWQRSAPAENFNNNGYKQMINNTAYLRMTNASGATRAISYTGVQIK
tara:strand:+ start:493 stop:792 length:300 start_codon:yes stop_codon:yes gene_type:complete